MTTKEKYFEIINALQEQIKTNSVERKAYKPAYKDWQRSRSNSDITRWDYWNHPDYKKLSEFTGDLTPLNETETTVLHILYNRIRNRPAHTGSFESDERYLTSVHGDCMYGKTHYSKMMKTLLENHAVKCEPKEEHIEMFEANNG